MTPRVRLPPLVAFSFTIVAAAAVPPDVAAPWAADSVRFAVIGDSGTGGTAQYQVAKRLAEARDIFPFEFVLMAGDNLYGSERPQDYVQKFEKPYASATTTIPISGSTSRST